MFAAMKKISAIIILINICISNNLSAQISNCEIKYYYEVLDYVKDIEKGVEVLPYVITQSFINDSTFVRIQELTTYKIKRKVKFDMKNLKVTRTDTFIVRDREVYALKNKKKFLVYSKDKFKQSIMTSSRENLYADSTDTWIGTVKYCYFPVKDTMIDNKKGYIYRFGYINSYIHYYDMAKNGFDTGFVEMYKFVYVPGFGEVLQFNDENYYKYHLISVSNSCDSRFRKQFAD